MKWLIPISGLFLTFTLSIPTFAQQKNQDQISIKDITGAEKVIGLQFSKVQQDSLQKDLEENLESYQTLRKIPLSNSIPLP